MNGRALPNIDFVDHGEESSPLRTGQLGVSVRVSIAMKRYREHSNYYKEKHLIGTGLWAHSCYSREHSDAQADIVLEKEPVVLHLHQQVSGRKSG